MSRKEVEDVAVCQRKMSRKVLGVSLKDRILNTSTTGDDINGRSSTESYVDEIDLRRSRCETMRRGKDAEDHNVGSMHWGWHQKRSRRRWADLFRDQAWRLWPTIARFGLNGETYYQ